MFPRTTITAIPFRASEINIAWEVIVYEPEQIAQNHRQQKWDAHVDSYIRRSLQADTQILLPPSPLMGVANYSGECVA